MSISQKLFLPGSKISMSSHIKKITNQGSHSIKIVLEPSGNRIAAQKGGNERAAGEFPVCSTD